MGFTSPKSVKKRRFVAIPKVTILGKPEAKSKLFENPVFSSLIDDKLLNLIKHSSRNFVQRRIRLKRVCLRVRARTVKSWAHTRPVVTVTSTEWMLCSSPYSTRSSWWLDACVLDWPRWLSHLLRRWSSSLHDRVIDVYVYVSCYSPPNSSFLELQIPKLYLVEMNLTWWFH